MKKLFWLSIFACPSLFAHTSIRLDKPALEEFSPFSTKYEVIISDNCGHCLNQLSILKECVSDNDVVILLDNKSKLSEENLKKLMRKKKIDFKTFLLDEHLRKTYAFNGVTPTLWMNKKSYTGVVACEFLKSQS
jgi:hypothetical protein